MRRLSLVAFGALIAATVAAFFVTQHLKVSTPLIAGFPAPSPAAINPYGASCGGENHGIMRISFYLLHRADTVAVYVVDESGTIVRTLATDRQMRRRVRHPDGDFSWNGREDNGTVAPDGEYYIRVALLGQGRTIQLTKTPITVKTIPPRPVVRSVSPSLIPRDGVPVTIRYAGNEDQPPTVLLYRTDLPGRPRLVDSFTVSPHRPANWNGHIHGMPAPAGTYLVGLKVTDAACNVGRFPIVLPPPPGSTPHAGVTVRYLAAEPPLEAVPAGTRAIVNVDARGRPYSWTLWRVGLRKPIASGAQRGHLVAVRLPRSNGPGLYKLSLRSGTHRSEIPLLARSASPGHRVLVVLPALTWQGENPVDDPPSDGIPNTLDDGGPVELDRVLANGLPSGFSDEEGLLAYLDKARLGYDLTTDVALIDGTGPALSHHALVVLAGAERWLPSSQQAGLRAYVQGGGHLVSLGTGSLLRGVTVRAAPTPQAVDPTPPASTDALGARPGSLVEHNADLITVIRDGLGIFNGTSGAFSGYGSFEPIAAVAPPAEILSEAGTGLSGPSIVGYALGKGIVVDIGLVGFGSSLAHDVDAQELVSRLWTVLGR